MSTNIISGRSQYPDWLLEGIETLRLRRFEEALIYFAEGICSTQHAFQAQIGMGRALEGLGRIEAARFAFQRALRISPQSTDASRHLAALGDAPPVPPEWIMGQELTSDVNGYWQYKVLDVKRGGFGTVYIVSGFENQPLVLKTLQSHIAWSEEDRRRFEREIVTWLRIGNHPHIVRAICLDRVEGRAALIMEYLPGGTVGDAMTRGPLDREAALSFALDVCKGMNYVHDTFGILHRDLKPSNCLLTESGRVKVTDFGLAKLLSEFKAKDIGLPEMVMHISQIASTPLGTQSYMPPEQYERGAVLDTRSDIYSFGVMLFEMLTGELPRYGPAARELVQQSEASQTLPEHLREIILRCVALDRDHRPTNFRWLQVELTDAFIRMVGREPAPLERVPAIHEMHYNTLGMTFMQLGHLEEAVQFFDQGLDISPLDRYLLSNRGTTLRKLSRFQEALDCYKAVLEVDPDSAGTWGNVAQLYILMGDHQSALRALEKALEITPDDSVLIGNKAVVLVHLGLIPEALAFSAAAITANPKGWMLLTVRAGLLSQLGRYKDALACLDQAIAVHPLNPDAWTAKAFGLHTVGNHRDALVCAQRALELRPNQSDLVDLKTKLLEIITT